MNNSNSVVLDVAGVAKSYRLGAAHLEILKDVSFQLRGGEWLALLGASGSGKTTLLNILGLLETPDAGSVRAAGSNYAELRGRRAAEFRNRKLGFVFQSYCLLPELTILENVMLPGLLAGRSRSDARTAAGALLDRVGLNDRTAHRPTELSGGEQQRASIARALINAPELLFADEPTGNLDSRTGEEILALFDELRAASPERAIVMITHNSEVAARADLLRTLKDGVLIG